LHFGKTVNNNNNNNLKEIISSLVRIGPFFYSSLPLYKICTKFDIVISDGNLRYIDRNLLIINPFRKYKWINWGIGVSASLDKKIGTDTRFDFFRFFIFKNADAHIFYSDFPLKLYLEKGFERKKLFVGWNTVINHGPKLKNYDKDSLIFVGSLYKQKGIFELLTVFKKYLQNKPSFLKLHIVGEGPEYNRIKNFIQENQLSTSIILHGPIYDSVDLGNLYGRSLLCISPNQAGLSVLTSMSYGVPFVTKYDAITGGEILSIRHLYNGYFYNSEDDLLSLINDLHINKKTYINMGINALNFYIQERNPEQLVQVIINSFNYVLKNNINESSIN